MITEGNPSGVELVLMSISPGVTGATGSPALKAGLPGYCPYHAGL